MRARNNMKVMVFILMTALVDAFAAVAMADEAKPAADLPAGVTSTAAVLPAAATPVSIKVEQRPTENKAESNYGANAVMLNASNIGLTMPLGMTWVQASYSRRIWGALGATLEPLYFGIDKAFTEKDIKLPFSVSGFGTTVGLPIFPFSGEAVHGFYIKPRVSYLLLNGTIGVTTESAGKTVAVNKSGNLTVMSAGASIGWNFQWQFGLMIGFELIGAEYAMAGGELGTLYTNKMPIHALAHIWPVLPSTSLGWSF